MLDQRLHGATDKHSKIDGKEDEYLKVADIARIVADTQRDFTRILVPDRPTSGHCPLSHTHLGPYPPVRTAQNEKNAVGVATASIAIERTRYGAAYYSYQFAEVISRATWQKLFAADPLSRDAGERLRCSVLARGSSCPPSATLIHLLGSVPNPLDVDLSF